MTFAAHLSGHRRSIIALLVSLAMLGVLGLGAVALAWSFQSRLDQNIERIPALRLQPDGTGGGERSDGPPSAPQADQDHAPVNFLVLGTDSRISAGDPAEWERGAQRTDALMLVQLSADRRSLTVMSVPRDSWVEIPGHGLHKINAAFSFGGPLLTVRTVEHLTGAQIHHVAITDFESFATLTDALGGVDITLDQPLTVGEVTLGAGDHRLTGEQALRYVRERYNVAGGDLGRVQRHQNWMRAVMTRVLAADLITDPGRLVGFLDAVSRSVAVDEGFSIGEMRDLAISARDLRPDDVRFITAPYRGTGWSPDGRQSVVVLDDDAMDEVAGAFAEGTIAELLESKPKIAPRLGDDVN